MNCRACEVGWDEACDCVVCGPRTLGDELPDLVTAYFRAMKVRRDEVVYDPADFAAWIGAELSPEEDEDLEVFFQRGLRELHLDDCDDDGPPALRRAPRYVSTRDGIEELRCVGCDAVVGLSDAYCHRCGVEFTSLSVVQPDLEALLRASIEANEAKAATAAE